jgi:HlyD family secretion protein
MTWDNNKNAFVYVPDSRAKDGQKKIPVVAGISNGNRTEILSGLSEGNTVVLQQ